MDDKGNIHLIEAFAEGYKLTNIETKEVQHHEKLPNLFKMIPSEDYEKVKEMSLNKRLQYYNQLIEKEKQNGK